MAYMILLGPWNAKKKKKIEGEQKVSLLSCCESSYKKSEGPGCVSVIEHPYGIEGSSAPQMKDEADKFRKRRCYSLTSLIFKKKYVIILCLLYMFIFYMSVFDVCAGEIGGTGSQFSTMGSILLAEPAILLAQK